MKELFEIITGRVKEFVFKHDSVRVIQCALKYANPAQKKQIAEELGGSYRDLAESRYAKFLVAKLVMLGDEVRDLIVQEFYGHVKRLIKHPEAGWIVDDIYRGAATAHQKAILLREWYGPEFVVFKGKTNSEAGGHSRSGYHSGPKSGETKYHHVTSQGADEPIGAEEDHWFHNASRRVAAILLELFAGHSRAQRVPGNASR